MTRARPGFHASMDSDKKEISIQVSGTRAPVTVLLDTHGVPTISASGENDLAFAMGYMHARDRRFQMELLRMDALGRLRELLGGNVPEAILRLELFSRMIGFPAEAAEIYAGLPDEDRAMLQAYADGVNEATRREKEPFEFGLLGYSPAPWTPEDTLSILAMVSFGFCKNWEQELLRLELMVSQLRTGSGIENALAIWPARLDLPPHLIGTKPESDPFARIPAVAPELFEYLTSSFSGRERIAEGPEAGQPSGAPVEAMAQAWSAAPSSNNWAVDGTWTGTGKAAIALDPHMPLSLPPYVYMTAIRVEAEDGKGFEVMGAGIPGLPAIPFGTNGKTAWGLTSNWADVTDLYVEREAEGRPGWYLTENGQEPFTVREETFKVRANGGFKLEKRTVRSTRHGVIVNDFVERLPRGFPLVALKRAQTFGRSLRSMRLLYEAGTVAEARKALEGFTVLVGHWALADSSGSIGYAGPVNLPVRKTFLGTVPVPGWTGGYEWQGFVPANEMPSIENPAAHYLATANNQIVQPESAGYPINFEGDVPHRSDRILERLSAGNMDGRTAANLRSIQADGADASFLAVAGLLRETLRPLLSAKDELTARAAGELMEWDGMTDPQSPAPTIYQSFISHLLIETLSDEVAPGTLNFLLFYFNVDPLLFGILQNPSNPAWDDRRTAEVETADETIRLVFRKTAHALAKAYGDRVEGWKWKKAAPFDISHYLGSVLGFAGINRNGLSPAGTASSVFMHKYGRGDPVRFPVSYGPVLRIVVDFSNPPASSIAIPGGQSGRPSSPNYADILPLFVKGEGIALDQDYGAREKLAVRKVTFLPDIAAAE